MQSMRAQPSGRYWMKQAARPAYGPDIACVTRRSSEKSDRYATAHISGRRRWHARACRQMRMRTGLELRPSDRQDVNAVRIARQRRSPAGQLPRCVAARKRQCHRPRLSSAHQFDRAVHDQRSTHTAQQRVLRTQHRLAGSTCAGDDHRGQHGRNRCIDYRGTPTPAQQGQ
ncbi:hypothetical protein DFQ30_004539 [Apophysomyces sp. BC1015]|nr:hypothetical protein DFQ30_004539 [Apophysomyces sp. BC1015]